MAWANERAEGVIEEAIVAMRRSVIPRRIPMWTYRERRNRAAFSNAQHAWDFARDPLWDQPEPEPEPEDEEQEADDGLGE